MHKKILFCILVIVLSNSAYPQTGKSITVLQWNIWQEGTMVQGGYESIVNEIARLKPDFVTLSEVRNYNKTRFNDRIIKSLQAKGVTYYSFYSYDSGILSRHPLTDSATIFPEKDDHGSLYKLTTEVSGRKIALYSGHLDYLNCAYYNVKGYDGSTWKPILPPRTVEEVLTVNVSSQRDDAIKAFIADATKSINAGYAVILGGDFNEPSHLDWTHATKDLFDHHSMVIPWTVSNLLFQNGFSDAYRQHYPNAATHPGFTYPVNNPAVPVNKLTWAPNADERERIDFIYFSNKDFKVMEAKVYGPDSSIKRSKRTNDQTKDSYLSHRGIWPSDHKGVWVKFSVTPGR